MSYKGTVKNGVVVLEPGVKLPEGMDVRVEAQLPSKEQPGRQSPRPEEDPLWGIPDLAADTGIPDLAANLDHYLYGHPKVTGAN